MGEITHILSRVGAAAALTVLLFSTSSLALAASHPRLVNVESTKCSLCHEDLTRGFESVHPPVEDDCTSCHDVTVAESGTTIELSAPEPELCLMCHDTMEAAAAGDLAAPHAPVADSCLNCHQPHAGRYAALLDMPRSKLCAECHDTSDLNRTHGSQLTETVDCTSCHQAHGSQNPRLLIGANRHAPFADGTCVACHREPFSGRIRLRARREKVCTSCHDGLSQENGDSRSVHAALTGTRKKAGCLNCHNPHMSAHSSLLEDDGVALCRKCHESLVTAASAETGHAPAAEDCSNCHLPHSSAHQSLLVEQTPDLCVMCHDADDEDLITAHLQAPMESLDCISCHSPHGEGNEYLLAKNMHAVISEGCDTCHESKYNELIADGGSELCLGCHDEIGEIARNAKFPHAAMEMARCADCHNPHASPQSKLLVAASGGECTQCHEDIAAGPDEVAHGVITLIGCRACHQPHGGENAKLLKASGSELCLSCHSSSLMPARDSDEPITVFGALEFPAELARRMAAVKLSADGEHGHPITGHRVLGKPTEEEIKWIDVTFTEEMNCLTCHNPHKGKSNLLLQWGARSSFDACNNCHPK